jgi:hypothetical protein
MGICFSFIRGETFDFLRVGGGECKNIKKPSKYLKGVSKSLKVRHRNRLKLFFFQPKDKLKY